MEEPTKIVDLTSQLLRQSDFKPHEDIEIGFTGLRPGEKPEKVLSSRLENVTQTEHPQILRLASPVQDCDGVRPLDELALAAENLGLLADELKELLVKAAPEYTLFIANQTKTPYIEVRRLTCEESACALPVLYGSVASEHF